MTEITHISYQIASIRWDAQERLEYDARNGLDTKNSVWGDDVWACKCVETLLQACTENGISTIAEAVDKLGWPKSSRSALPSRNGVFDN